MYNESLTNMRLKGGYISSCVFSDVYILCGMWSIFRVFGVFRLFYAILGWGVGWGVCSGLIWVRLGWFFAGVSLASTLKLVLHGGAQE